MSVPMDRPTSSLAQNATSPARCAVRVGLDHVVLSDRNAFGTPVVPEV
jgi:hypothetical protein